MPEISRDDLQQEIHALVHKYSNKDDLTVENAMAINQLGIDSIDLMEIVFRLEETHGVEIDDLALGGTKTLGDIIDLAEANLTNAG